MSDLFGYKIVASSFLAGAKSAFEFEDSCFLVSPAMWDLIVHCENEAELRHLLANIPARKLPFKMSLDIPELGMTVTTPSPEGDGFFGHGSVAVEVRAAQSAPLTLLRGLLEH